MNRDPQRGVARAAALLVRLRDIQVRRAALRRSGRERIEHRRLRNAETAKIAIGLANPSARPGTSSSPKLNAVGPRSNLVTRPTAACPALPPSCPRPARSCSPTKTAPAGQPERARPPQPGANASSTPTAATCDDRQDPHPATSDHLVITHLSAPSVHLPDLGVLVRDGKPRTSRRLRYMYGSRY